MSSPPSTLPPSSSSLQSPTTAYHPEERTDHRHGSISRAGTSTENDGQRSSSSTSSDASSREINNTERFPDPDSRTWVEFLRDERHVPDNPRRLNRSNDSGSGLSSADKKRRLTNTSDDAGQRRYRTGPSVPSNSRSDLSTRNSWRNSTPIIPNRNPSNDNIVDLTGPQDSVPRRVSSLSRRERSFTDYTRPRWQPDSEVSHCPICYVGFGFWYRKHHCRKCGRVVCASCSPHRITIPRQFIVRPPESSRPLSTIIQPNPSPVEVVNLVDDEPSSATLSGSRNERTQQPLNPALGGGEEVRLCNPCVPDPNPEPPRYYGSSRSSGRRSSGNTISRDEVVEDFLHGSNSRTDNNPFRRQFNSHSSSIVSSPHAMLDGRRQRFHTTMVSIQ